MSTPPESSLRITPHVGVIGGGMAGLTAALRFAQAGYRVTLWERGQRLGGQAAAFPVSGSHLEFFYHHLFQSDRAITELAEELGIGGQLQWLPSNVGYFAEGKIWPLNGALDLLRLGFIPFHDRVRLGLVTAYLQRVRDWKKYEKVTAHRWLGRALGQRAYNRTLGAQLKAKFGRYYDEVAMVWFWGKIWLRTTSRRSPLEQEKLGYFKGSFNVIIDALAERCRHHGVEIQTGTGPTMLDRKENGRWSVAFEDHMEEVDLVVATVPSSVFSRLVPDLPEGYRAKLLGLTYEAAAVAILQMDRPLTDIYWLNIADPDIPFTGVIEHTNFVDPAEYGGSHFLYLSKYMEPDHPYFALSDGDLIEEYVPYLKRINPEFERSWINRWWVFRERAAQPIVTLNYSEKIPEHRTPLKGLYLANTTQIYPEDRGTNYSVRLGNQIAELVRRDVEHPETEPITAR
jgi:protoporphyrinogen oxidase